MPNALIALQLGKIISINKYCCICFSQCRSKANKALNAFKEIDLGIKSKGNDTVKNHVCVFAMYPLA